MSASDPESGDVVQQLAIEILSVLKQQKSNNVLQSGAKIEEMLQSNARKMRRNRKKAETVGLRRKWSDLGGQEIRESVSFGIFSFEVCFSKIPSHSRNRKPKKFCAKPWNALWIF